MSQHLLVIEDDAGLRGGLKMNFEFEGYRVSAAEDGIAGLELALSLMPDLVILDIMLPRMNGYDICRRIRSAGLDVPVLLLTIKREETERVLGFEVGAEVGAGAEKVGRERVPQRVRGDPCLNRGLAQPAVERLEDLCAVDQHGARAAVTLVATLLRADESELVT